MRKLLSPTVAIVAVAIMYVSYVTVTGKDGLMLALAVAAASGLGGYELRGFFPRGQGGGRLE